MQAEGRGGLDQAAHHKCSRTNVSCKVIFMND
jgi:hypothetical protein